MSDAFEAELPRRSGKNIGGYLGERIEVNSVLLECVAAARAHGFSIDDIPVGENVSLCALRRPGGIAKYSDGNTNREQRVYISAGIHGDEPAGPLAIRRLLQDNRWPAGVALWLCPCLNPDGFLHHRRENADGADLNRQYLSPQARETRAHISWLERQPSFDLCLCLHEDWEAQGFYVYELNPENRASLAPEMVERIGRICPLDLSELIEGRPATGGVIRPSLDPRDRPQWPEAFYLLTHKTRLCYTLEAPSDFSLDCRVAALVTAVNTALELIHSPRQSAAAQQLSSRPE